MSVVTATPLNALRSHAQSAPQRASVAGTYRIILCKAAECSMSDTTNAVAWGELVLASSALPDSVR